MKRSALFLLGLVLLLLLLTGCSGSRVQTAGTKQPAITGNVKQEAEIIEILEEDSPLPIQTEVVEEPAGHLETRVSEGRYYELYSYNYIDPQTGIAKKALSKELYEPQFVPYIELFEDGTYDFYLNMYHEMVLVSGPWTVDEANPRFVYLSRPTNIADVATYDRLFLEKVAEDEFVLRGVHKIGFDSSYTTSAYGNVYTKKDPEQQDLVTGVRYEAYDWPRLYLNFVHSMRMERTRSGSRLILDNRMEGVGSVLVLEVTGDDIPELWLSDHLNELFYIYTVKGNKVVNLGSVYFGDVVLRKNPRTNQAEVFIYSQDEGISRISRPKIASGKAVMDVLFMVEAGGQAGQTADEYYVNGEKVTGETYREELAKFEEAYELVDELAAYEVNIRDWESLELGIEKIIHILDEFILK